MIKNKVKTIFILTILFGGLVLTMNFSQAQEATPDRELEIVYPIIPGETTEKVVFSGLPEYVEYIFKLSIWLIGLVILGALIYAGFQYFTSFGNPEKLSSAKNGITSAILGAIILLSAVLIFNTINPQLVILEAPPLDVLEATVIPGIYLCNYNVGNIHLLIPDYVNNNPRPDERRKIRTEAAKKLTEVMSNKKGSCAIIPASMMKLQYPFEPGKKKDTMFIIPGEKPVYNPKTKETELKWVNDYGVIFHQLDNFQGNCKLVEPLYMQIHFHGFPYPSLGFDQARSITLFKKPDVQGGQGVALYQCLYYDEPTTCLEGVSITGGTPFPPENNVRHVPTGQLGNLAGETSTEKAKGFALNIKKAQQYETKGDILPGARSIRIDPVGSFFAVLLGTNPVKYGTKENPTGHFCEIISNDDPNLLDNEIGRCGAACQIVARKDETSEWQNRNCFPCLQSMIVVKGEIIK